MIAGMKNAYTSNHQERRVHNERGNVLWFILIAVVLLGALTMALSRSSTNVDQSGDIEQSRIKGAQIMRYTKSLASGIEQLILSGCSENEISFETAAVAGYENTINPDQESCFLFSPKGAGLSWQSFSAADIFSGKDLTVQNNIRVVGVGTDGAAAGANDLIALVKTTEPVCTSINKELGIPTNYSHLEFSMDEYVDPFIGNFVTTSREIGDAASLPLKGKPVGCGLDQNGDYIFYHVLIAR